MATNSFRSIPLLFFLFSIYFLTAQTVFESTVTTETFIVESWWTKPLDNNYRLVPFVLSSAEYSFNQEATSFLSYSVLNVDLWEGLGPVVGTRLLRDRLLALGGIQYTYFRENAFLTINFTTEIKDHPDFELYALAQYRPQITQQLKGFIQVQFSFNFNSTTHLFSLQQIRTGLDFGRWQGGLALNQSQSGEGWNYRVQPGVFVRLEFQ